MDENWAATSATRSAGPSAEVSEAATMAVAIRVSAATSSVDELVAKMAAVTRMALATRMAGNPYDLHASPM